MPKWTRSLGRSQTKFEIGWRFFYFTYVSSHMSFRISLRFPGVVVCVFVLLCFTVFVCVCIGLCVEWLGVCVCVCVRVSAFAAILVGLSLPHRSRPIFTRLTGSQTTKLASGFLQKMKNMENREKEGKMCHTLLFYIQIIKHETPSLQNKLRDSRITFPS